MADVSPQGVTDFGSLMTSFGQGMANQNLTNQQAQGLSLQNKVTAARVPIIVQALKDYGNSVNGSGSPITPGGMPEEQEQQQQQQQTEDQSGVESPSSNASWYNPAQIDAGLRNRYFVNPAGTQAEVQNIVRAGMAGDPGLLASAKAQRQFGVQQRLAQSQYDSSNLYDAMTAVVNSPSDEALSTLEAIAPRTAARIKQQIPDDANEDGAARAYAAHVAGAVHMYTGREVLTRPDGTYVDKTTGQPVPGVERSGMTQEQWANLAEKGMQMVSQPQSDGSTKFVPTYQAAGFNNLQDWVMRTAAGAGVQGALPTISGAPAAAAHAGAAAAVQHVQAAANRATQPPSGTPGTPAAAGALSPATATPQLRAALADTSWRDPSAPGQTRAIPGQTMSTLNQGLTQTYIAQRKAAQDEFSTDATAASQALMNFKAAYQILNASDGTHLNAISGLPGAISQMLGRAGYDTTTADQRVEAAKYLTNAAVAGIKNTYGSRPAMFDVKVNLEKAFPNIEDMPYNAMKKLTLSQIKQTSYMRDSAVRGSMYINAGNRPTDFPSWNEHYFPRSDILVPGSSKNNGGTAPTANKPKWSPAQITKYAKQYFGGDEGKANAYLESH